MNEKMNPAQTGTQGTPTHGARDQNKPSPAIPGNQTDKPSAAPSVAAQEKPAPKA